MVSKRRLFLLLALVLLITGCTPGSSIHDLVGGETLSINSLFTCYFSAGKNKYVKMTDAFVPLITSEPQWVPSEGLILENTSLKVHPHAVSWQTDFLAGTTDHSVEGFWISASMTIRVAEDSPVGKKQILLTLPSLAELSTALKAEVQCPKMITFNHKQSFISPATFDLTGYSAANVLSAIVVHASEADRNRANTWQTIRNWLIFAAVIIGIGGGIWLWAWSDRK